MDGVDLDPLRLLTKSIDWTQRRLRRIKEFSTDPDCLYRISTGSAPRDTTLPDGTQFRQGDPIGFLHIWGEHMPKIPESGIHLGWAKKMNRSLHKSNQLLAQHVSEEQFLRSLPAFGNDFFLYYTKTAVHLLERIGYAVLQEVPPGNLWHRIQLETIRRWTWLLRRTFNPQSVQYTKVSDLRMRPVWLSQRALFEKYL